MYDVAVVRYEKPLDSLKKAVDLVGGLNGISPTSKVFIKPNFCVWHEEVNYPKYGVLTTARLIEDVVILLREREVKDITITEGVVEIENRHESTLNRLAKGLGLDILTKRYGVKIIDALRGEFTRITAVTELKCLAH